MRKNCDRVKEAKRLKVEKLRFKPQNDLCDGLQLHSGPLVSVRGATPPSRNGLSNANRERPAAMAEQLF